jgi:hypothetical protein
MLNKNKWNVPKLSERIEGPILKSVLWSRCLDLKMHETQGIILAGVQMAIDSKKKLWLAANSYTGVYICSILKIHS